MKRLTFLLICPLFFLSACTQIKEQDFFGDWIINSATFNGSPIKMRNDTIKGLFFSSEYLNKLTLRFNKDSTVDFPGIYTQDVPCKWLIKNEQLVISFDTLRFRNNALIQIDSLGTLTMLNHDPNLRKKYLFKRDSILAIKNLAIFNNPIKIYVGLYNINKRQDQLIITSPTTQFDLINADNAIKKEINKMFKF